MSSIPLPALSIHPPQQQEGPMDNYAKLMQLKTLMGQQQVQQQQMQGAQLENQTRSMQNQQMQMDLKTRQIIAKSVVDSGGDYQKALDLAQQQGADPMALMQYRQNLMNYTKEQQSFVQSQNDLLQGAHDAVAKLPPASQDPAARAAAWQKQLAQLKAMGVKGADQLPQTYPGDAQFDSMGAELQAHSKLQDDAFKHGEVAKNAAQEREANATASQKELETEQMKQYGGMNQQAADAKYRFLQQKVAGRQPISPDDQTWLKAYEKQKLLVPQATAQIRIEGMQESRQLPVYDNKMKAPRYVSAAELNRAAQEEPSRYTPAPYSPEALGAKDTTDYFTKGKGGQQLTAFNTAMVHLDTLDRLAKDLNNTDIQVVNKAKQAWAQQTGSPAPANFAAAKNAMSGEVASALKASGATDQEIAKVGETFDKAQSPAQLKGAIGTYRELLRGKRDQLKGQYESGMKGQPNFQGQQQQAAPAGATHTGKGSVDGKIHWLDAKGNDLGVKQ